LIDKNRHIRGIYNGLDPNSIATLSKDIKALRQES
jgi:protein SCO1